jgi:hypothetical protein
MCLQPRLLSLPLRGFRIGACAGRDTGAENEGDMNSTLRTKKNVLSATPIAVLYARGAGGRPPLKVESTQTLVPH